jgi:hypothetical protein
MDWVGEGLSEDNSLRSSRAQHSTSVHTEARDKQRTAMEPTLNPMFRRRASQV